MKRTKRDAPRDLSHRRVKVDTPKSVAHLQIAQRDEPEMIATAPATEANLFRENLEFACESRGSTSDIIRKSDVARSHFYKILRGETVPTLDVAARIAAAVGVPLEQMISKKRVK